MIKELTVENLNGELSFHKTFNDDLNIFTGKNGSGKTNLLKLIWYSLSGNLEFAVSEISFDSVILVTSSFILDVKKERIEQNQIHVDVEVNNHKGALIFEGVFDFNPLDKPQMDEVNTAIISLEKKSLFFPSFRRIEGRFAISEGDKRDYAAGVYDQIKNAMKNFSNRLSVHDHHFISSISTVDISELINSKIANLSQRIDHLSQKHFEKIIEKIQLEELSEKSKVSGEGSEQPNLTLKEIKDEIVKFQNYRENIRKPLSILTDLISKIYKGKGVKFGRNLIFGDVKAVDADILSAGEKQMLSFLCYNTFYHGCPIFIDEPELSLNIDWQRILFQTLLNQNNGNQFFIATHSPFIYSQYPDKEFALNSDHGDISE